MKLTIKDFIKHGKNILGITEDITLNNVIDIINSTQTGGPLRTLLKVLKHKGLFDNREVSTCSLNKIEEFVKKEEDKTLESSIDSILLIKTFLNCINKEEEFDKIIKNYYDYISESKNKEEEENMSPLMNTVAGIFSLTKVIYYKE